MHPLDGPITVKHSPEEDHMSQQSRRDRCNGGGQPEDPVHPGADWVPLRVPGNLESMLLNWTNFQGPSVGWCLLCDQPIRSEDDFIPGTNTHSCDAGLRFELEHNEA